MNYKSYLPLFANNPQMLELLNKTIAREKEHLESLIQSKMDRMASLYRQEQDMHLDNNPILYPMIRRRKKERKALYEEVKELRKQLDSY